MILDITRETCFPTLLFWLSSWIKCSVKKNYYDQPQIQCMLWRCRLADVWDVALLISGKIVVIVVVRVRCSLLL